MNRISILIVCCLLCIGASLYGQRIYVKAGSSGNGSSWAQASGDLRAVLSTAMPGTEIWVAQGSYYPTTCSTCTSADRDLYFEIREGVEVYGGFNGTETSINQRDWHNNQTVLSGDIDMDSNPGNNSYTIIYSHNISASTIVDGFFIQHGNADNVNVPVGAPGNTGAGWYNDGSQNGSVSNPIIRNCTFRWNETVYSGGGMYNDGCFEGEGNPTLINCVFNQNFAAQGGGGMYNNGSFEGVCSPIYINCEFTSNTTENSGAALFNNGLSGISSPVLTNTLFYDNRADFYGGGIYNLGKEGNASPEITNCLFDSNHGSAAGGIYNLGSENGNSSPIVTNCTFYGNTAPVGACIYNQAGDSTGTCNTIVVNSIFHGNDASSGFGYIFQNVYASPTISYSLVQVNNCFELNTGLNGSVNCGNGLIFNQNPLFENPAGNNFRVQAGSPVLDVGDNNEILATGVTVDLDSLARITNGTVDLGAYEFIANQYISPSILTHPQAQTVCAEESLLLEVQVNGSRPLSYQWQKDGVNISGATDSTFAITNSQPADTGNYRCRINGTMQDTIWSNTALLTVNELLPVSVNINASNLEICEGELISFTANAVNAGGQPTYQWKLNGSNVGTNKNTYSSSNIISADVISCQLVSSESCVTGNPANSNEISILVNEILTPAIQINASDIDICEGEMVTFTADIVNGGNSPVFQWQINGMNVGGNTNQFSSTNLMHDDQVTCMLSSSEICKSPAVVTSNEVVMAVSAELVVSIQIDPSSISICEGEMINFNSITMNGGVSPNYQWQVNGLNVGRDTASFSSTDLTDGDKVTCLLTSSETCINSTTVNSNEIIVAVAELLDPSIQIQAEASAICDGENIQFTSSVLNEGDNPSYQWQINGLAVGTDTSVFNTNNLIDGDIVSCLLSSSETCVSNVTVTSNTETISVNELLIPEISIDASTDQICAGESITFTAQTVNGGLNPSFTWELNGQNVGTNNNVFSTDELQNSDEVRCYLLSSEMCRSIDTVFSSAVTVDVSPIVEPSVDIVAAIDTTSCRGDTLHFTANITNGGAQPFISWLINNNEVSTDTETYSTDLLNDGDLVSCIIESSASCLLKDTAKSNVIIIDMIDCTSSTTDLFSERNIQLYPNPTNQYAYLSLKQSITGARIKIYNSIGQVLYNDFNAQLNAGSSSYKFDLSKLNQGSYWISIEANEMSRILTLLIVK